jgi:Collagen triple helix repeat (20 copies)
MGTIPLTNRLVRYAMVAAVSGLAVSGMAAIAAKKPAGGQITACYAKKSGALRVLKAGKRCKRGERKIAWTKNGARGARGVRGARGSQGPEGGNGARGATGPAGVAGAPGVNGSPGAPGADGTARAYAEVNDVSNDYVAARTDGFTGTVTKPGATTGIYCLTPDPTLGIDPSTVAAVASPSFGNTSAHGGSAEVRGAPGGACSITEFAVHTYDSGGTASDSVSFHIIVP